jgi:hypothetical protein
MNNASRLVFAGALALGLGGCAETAEKKAQEPLAPIAHAASVESVAPVAPAAPAAPIAQRTDWTYEESRPIRIPEFVDFAHLEYSQPLSLEYRRKLQPEDLRALDQEAIDQIYARLTAGPIPDGAYAGQVFLKAGKKGYLEVNSMLLGYFQKMLVEKGMAATDLAFEKVAEALWEGKKFSRRDRTLVNGISNIEPLRLMRFVQGTPPTGKLEGKTVYWLFPAKVHCGQSLLDSRRESIVIDYLFSDELSDYREMPDFLAGRRGLQVRDEIRMVRPGFYIGRAHVNRIFLLSFTLYNKEIDARERERFTPGPKWEDCWIGTQAQHTPPR